MTKKAVSGTWASETPCGDIPPSIKSCMTIAQQFLMKGRHKTQTIYAISCRPVSLQIRSAAILMESNGRDVSIRCNLEKSLAYSTLILIHVALYEMMLARCYSNCQGTGSMSRAFAPLLAQQRPKTRLQRERCPYIPFRGRFDCLGGWLSKEYN